jgi:hypothetical protein
VVSYARPLRIVHVTRRAQETLPEILESSRRSVLRSRSTSTAVPRPVEQASRLTAYTRVPREVLESRDVALRTVEMSRLGAEQIATEDTTSRSLTVIRLGAEEFGVSDSASRSALFTRRTTEVTSTDLVVLRTVDTSRTVDLSLTLDVAQQTSLVYARTVEDFIEQMEDEAKRERLYRTKKQRFPHPYELDLATSRPYDLVTGRSRPMVLDLSTEPAYGLDTSHEEIYVLETDSGLWVVLTTDTEG